MLIKNEQIVILKGILRTHDSSCASHALDQTWVGPWVVADKSCTGGELALVFCVNNSDVHTDYTRISSVLIHALFGVLTALNNIPLKLS